MQKSVNGLGIRKQLDLEVDGCDVRRYAYCDEGIVIRTDSRMRKKGKRVRRKPPWRR